VYKTLETSHCTVVAVMTCFLFHILLLVPLLLSLSLLYLSVCISLYSFLSIRANYIWVFPRSLYTRVHYFPDRIPLIYTRRSLVKFYPAAAGIHIYNIYTYTIFFFATPPTRSTPSRRCRVGPLQWSRISPSLSLSHTHGRIIIATDTVR